MAIHDEVRNQITNVINKFHNLGFWIIVILIIGFTIGVGYSEKTTKNKISDAITLGGMIHDGKVYDIQERVIIKQ